MRGEGQDEGLSDKPPNGKSPTPLTPTLSPRWRGARGFPRRARRVRAPKCVGPEFVYRTLHDHGPDSHLGVDPGLRSTGWGVIEAAGSRLGFIGCGSIQTDAATSLAERLAAIHRALAALVEREGPHEAAIEETFLNRDPQSTLKLGQARGVALASLALSGLPVAEYAANLDQEDRRRRRPRGKATGGDDGEDAAARIRPPRRRTPPTRSRSPSATRSIARARARGAA